jgi:hypothetical protein
MDRYTQLFEKILRVASLRDIIVVGAAIAGAIAIGFLIALLETWATRRKLRDIVSAQDTQTRAMAVLATRLDNLAQLAAQLQLEQTKRREEAEPSAAADLSANLIDLRSEIESLRKETR